MRTTTTKKEKRKSTLRVFFSYAAIDKGYALKLRKLLSLRPNVQIFTTDMLSAGENWEAKLKKEIIVSDIFIVLLSPQSLESPWVMQLLGAAWGLQKPIIPVVTHPEVLSKIPVELQDAQLVDIRDLDNPEIINHIFERYEELVTV